MGILIWHKPQRTKTTEKWAEVMFEDGPKGAYIPNMSQDDRLLWKAKITGRKAGLPQVEIRKSTGGGELLIIVSLGQGYKYKFYSGTKTEGVNIHMSMNGPALLTFEDWADMQSAIAEARDVLEEMNDQQN